MEGGIQKTALASACMLSAIAGGCDTPAKLRRLLGIGETCCANKLARLRRDGLLRPFRGGRDFTLTLTPSGERLVVALILGLRAHLVKNANRSTKKAPDLG